jgi:cytosine/adenosine deaminase-related metal-dependent hydrolase
MKLGSGFAPVEDYLAKGINVALGTDGAASNNNLDMLEEMHIAALIHNGYHRDATIMSAEKILKMATVNGAKLQGRENCGNILPGYKADFVAVGTDGAASNNNLDMLEEMHIASLIHNGYHSDATIMSAEKILKMATLNGAILQGRES